MQAKVHRLTAAGPADTAPRLTAIERKDIIVEHIIAILGKTEGNGCVNDFTRAYATQSFKHMLSAQLHISLLLADDHFVLQMAREQTRFYKWHKIV